MKWSDKYKEDLRNHWCHRIEFVDGMLDGPLMLNPVVKFYDKDEKLVQEFAIPTEITDELLNQIIDFIS